MTDIKNTEPWYRSLENKAISASKVKAFRKSRAYYHSRYVLGVTPDDPTPSMLLGSMVDIAWSAGDVGAIGKCFTSDKADPEGRIRVTPSVMETATAIATQLLADPSYAAMTTEGESHVQEPLYGTVKKRHGKQTLALEICGLPDRHVVLRDATGAVTFIDLYDLKTARASDLDSDKNWYWKCVRMGYFEQLAVYAALLQRRYKVKPHQIRARHVVVGTTEDAGRYPCRLYKIPRTLYAGYFNKFMRTVVDISLEREFIDPPAEWQTLHAPDDYGVPVDDEV